MPDVFLVSELNWVVGLREEEPGGEVPSSPRPVGERRAGGVTHRGRR